jgi:hypothetical protein
MAVYLYLGPKRPRPHLIIASNRGLFALRVVSADVLGPWLSVVRHYSTLVVIWRPLR